jgi:hypothetical protein
MIRSAFAAAAFALALSASAETITAARPAKAPVKAAAPKAAAPAAEPTGMISFSLVEALAAIHQPQLAGIFSFVAEKNAPFAFADFLARDKKAMKLYLNKLGDDIKAAEGLTEWDHEVCASLINLYSSPLPPGFERADEKRMKQINDCMLARTASLEEIVAKRKK